MENFLPIIKKSKLFTGLDDNQISSALKCLVAGIKKYNKNCIVFCEGDAAEFMGLILSGEMQTQKIDYCGNVNIISKLPSSEIIAAAACFSSNKYFPFNVVTMSSCEILYLNISNLLNPCYNACGFHSIIIKNLLNIIADRNLLLSSKIDILTKRTIKEKVLAYLFAQSKKSNNKSFSIPLSRRQMAEFFSISRSALSKELSKMQSEGIIEFFKNHFTLKLSDNN